MSVFLDKAIITLQVGVGLYLERLDHVHEGSLQRIILQLRNFKPLSGSSALEALLLWHGLGLSRPYLQRRLLVRSCGSWSCKTNSSSLSVNNRVETSRSSGLPQTTTNGWLIVF